MSLVVRRSYQLMADSEKTVIFHSPVISMILSEHKPASTSTRILQYGLRITAGM
jgi:hypothetical protein